MVGRRRIRATLPGVEVRELESLEGVVQAQRHGETVSLDCSNSDAAVRALLARYPQLRDLEIAGAGLEDAFIALTTTQED
jgi:ABC-2 type transport system ATP-binding protein